MKAFKSYWQKESFFRLVVCVYWFTQLVYWLWLAIHLLGLQRGSDLVNFQAGLQTWKASLPIELWFDGVGSLSFWEKGILLLSLLVWTQLRPVWLVSAMSFVGGLLFCLLWAAGSPSLTEALFWLKLMAGFSLGIGSVFIFKLIESLIQILSDISHNFPYLE